MWATDNRNRRGNALLTVLILSALIGAIATILFTLNVQERRASRLALALELEKSANAGAVGFANTLLNTRIVQSYLVLKDRFGADLNPGAPATFFTAPLASRFPNTVGRGGAWVLQDGYLESDLQLYSPGFNPNLIDPLTYNSNAPPQAPGPGDRLPMQPALLLITACNPSALVRQDFLNSVFNGPAALLPVPGRCTTNPLRHFVRFLTRLPTGAIQLSVGLIKPQGVL